MADSIRIRTKPNGGDKYVKINLEQDFDFIEILSLKISQKDVYRKFCSDYGVVVGRVTVNNGFGVPNAKVSIFIPLDENDKQNSEISGLYPYEILSDKDDEGRRYNILPKDGALTNDCFTPIGSLPNKREVLDNSTMLEVYNKYYKFTTTTNHAGDFMIFGVPLGTYTVHLDADISDIGVISQRPYDLINQGTPAGMFESSTKFKGSKNLDTLIQVKTLNTGVNVQPFWGDVENCEVGITRLDFPLNYTVRPTAIFVGSIFGDQDKNSINKRCRPRRNLGELCEQVTGEGTINMIRKNLDGQIEEFDIDGGRVIDENGAWAYQIPMNLDYRVTNEDGTISYSDDPNVGLPTKTSVRFKIGLDETGGEGRLRTRAKYLVPNNPHEGVEADYRFGPATESGPATEDRNFKHLYWNQIYTVSNYIPRYQTQMGDNLVRGFTGIKDVDGCVGDKTPFPFNRLSTTTNPFFFIVCLLISYISILIWFLNLILIPIVNLAVMFLNSLTHSFCWLVNKIDRLLTWVGFNTDGWGGCNLSDINYIRCLTIECGGEIFAPGCASPPPNNMFTAGFTACNGGDDDQPNVAITYYPSDSTGLHNDNSMFGGSLDVGLSNCVAFQLATALNMYKYDFYNDWVNGTLYSYLLKYKKKRKSWSKVGREKFCEYECDGAPSFNPTDGIDANDNNRPDNSCYKNYLCDSGFQTGGGTTSSVNDTQNNFRFIELFDGLIKKVDDELIYATKTHVDDLPLFATDIVNLGSVLDCDWKGIPKINEYLVPSSYKIPPDISQINDDGTLTETCGVVSLGNRFANGNDGLFFTINCNGLHTDYRQTLNTRHLCEIGVDLDEAITDDNGVERDANCIIGVEDISGIYFRDVFFGLNHDITWNGLNDSWNTAFNLANEPIYDFANIGANGDEYKRFRYGISTVSNDVIQPTKHSYFFYFGLFPSKTGLDKMNSKYFTGCKRLVRDNMVILSETTSDLTGNNQGLIIFNVNGGVAEFTYTVTGPNTSSNGTLQSSNNTSTSATINGLGEGIYQIVVIDSLGTIASKKVVVSGVPSMFAEIYVSQQTTTHVSNDGEITIASINGGTSSYSYEVENANGTIVSSGVLNVLPKVISNLVSQSPIGYNVIITDSSTPEKTFIVNNLVVSGPEVLTIGITDTDVSCSSADDGVMNISINGGITPYNILTTASGGFSSSNINLTNLPSNTYTTVVTDNSPIQQSQEVQTIISSLSPQMVLTAASSAVLKLQCDSTQHKITFDFDISTGSAELQYNVDGTSWVSLGTITNGTNQVKYVPTLVTSQVSFRTKNGSCYSQTMLIPGINITRPTIRLTSYTRHSTTGGGDHDGSITVYPSGGIGPYSVKWLKNSNLTTYTNNPTLALAAGNYRSRWSCVVTDSVGCVHPSNQTYIT